jgi:hypothetical protein
VREIQVGSDRGYLWRAGAGQGVCEEYGAPSYVIVLHVTRILGAVTLAIDSAADKV